MRNLTMTDFTMMCEQNPSAVYVYDTYIEEKGEDELKRIHDEFNQVITMLNPNRICFRDGEDHVLCLNNVRKIQLDVDEEGDILLHIFCAVQYAKSIKTECFTIKKL